MELAPTTLGVILVCASLLVMALLIHYVVRVGRRYDRLCLNGMLAAATGLLAAGFSLRAARDVITPADLFGALSFSFCAFAMGLAVWQEGLRRFRNAG